MKWSTLHAAAALNGSTDFCSRTRAATGPLYQWTPARHAHHPLSWAEPGQSLAAQNEAVALETTHKVVKGVHSDLMMCFNAPGRMRQQSQKQR